MSTLKRLTGPAAIVAVPAGVGFRFGSGDLRQGLLAGAATFVVAVILGALVNADRSVWGKIRSVGALLALALAVGGIALLAARLLEGEPLDQSHLFVFATAVILVLGAAAAQFPRARRIAIAAILIGVIFIAAQATDWPRPDALLSGLPLVGAWPAVGATLILLFVVLAAHAVILSGDNFQGLQPAANDGNEEAARNLQPSEEAARYRRRGIRGVYIGKDGRVSTSKLQIVLWTLLVLFIIVHLYLQGRCLGPCGSVTPEMRSLRRAWAGADGPPLRPEYWALLGFPAATAAYVKALAKHGSVGKAAITVGEQEGSVTQGIRETIQDDDGFVDIGDLQYFLFSLFTIVFVLVQFLGTPESGFPPIPPTLLGLIGVSATAYGVKKTVTEGVGPEVLGVLPKEVIVGVDEELHIRGDGFVLPTRGQGEGKVLLAGRPLSAAHGDAWVKAIDWRPGQVTVHLREGEDKAEIYLRGAGIELSGDRLETTVSVRDVRGIESEGHDIVIRLPRKD